MDKKSKPIFENVYHLQFLNLIIGFLSLFLMRLSVFGSDQPSLSLCKGSSLYIWKSFGS